MPYFRVFYKTIAILIVTLCVVPPQVVVKMLTKGNASYFIPQLWHKAMCRILNIRVRFSGKPVAASQAFFIGNHLSHYDIFALGSRLRASFVAKNDLENSPVVKFMCELQQTAFISRSSSAAATASSNVRTMLDEGKSVILFPEGTSTRGDTVLDFKSTLFSLPIEYAGKGVRIQPFTQIVRAIDGIKPVTKEQKDIYAWDRDNPIEMGPHILNFMKHKGAVVEIIFHDPAQISPEEDRKQLSQRMREIVASPLVHQAPPV